MEKNNFWGKIKKPRFKYSLHRYKTFIGCVCAHAYAYAIINAQIQYLGNRTLLTVRAHKPVVRTQASKITPKGGKRVRGFRCGIKIKYWFVNFEDTSIAMKH